MRLTTAKYCVIGSGHVVSTYVGKRARPFTHKPLARGRKILE
jgi:hypothetical protein